jgi:HSP20 family protein
MANETQVWSPFRELERFRRDFDDLFERFLGGHVRSAAPGSLFPAVESYIEEGKLVIKADLPGIDPKDVEVTITGRNLTLKGKREQSRQERNHQYFHREVTYGAFERTLTLPDSVSADDIKASYRNGVLELTMPVPKHLGMRKVPIQVEGKSQKD